MQLIAPIGSIGVPSIQLEASDGIRDSQRIARVLFLRMIPKLKPHVVDDLWHRFWDLAFLVCANFANDLIDAPSGNSGQEIFQLLCKRSFQENLCLIRTEPVSWCSRTLACTLREFNKLDPAKLGAAFSTWSALPNGQLRNSLNAWSTRWKLDADWCRDHALFVCLKCLTDRGLQNSLLHPHYPKRNPYLHPPQAQTLKWI